MPDFSALLQEKAGRPESECMTFLSVTYAGISPLTTRSLLVILLSNKFSLKNLLGVKNAHREMIIKINHQNEIVVEANSGRKQLSFFVWSLISSSAASFTPVTSVFVNSHSLKKPSRPNYFVSDQIADERYSFRYAAS
jgi:hypothetical protein